MVQNYKSKCLFELVKVIVYFMVKIVLYQRRVGMG